MLDSPILNRTKAGRKHPWHCACRHKPRPGAAPTDIKAD